METHHQKSNDSETIATGTIIVLIILIYWYFSENEKNTSDYKKDHKKRPEKDPRFSINDNIEIEQKKYRLNDGLNDRQHFKMLTQDLSTNKVVKIIGVLSHIAVNPDIKSESKVFKAVNIEKKDKNPTHVLINFLNDFLCKNINEDWYKGLCATSQRNLYNILKTEINSDKNNTNEIISLYNKLEEELNNSDEF